MELVNGSSVFLKRIIIIFIASVFLLVIKEIVRYFFSSWLAFCVYYTMSDLYSKRKLAVRYFRFLKKICLYIIRDISYKTNEKNNRFVEKLSLSNKKQS